MLASKYAPRTASFDTETTVVLRGGQNFERILSKTILLEACPDLKNHVELNEARDRFVLKKVEFGPTVLNAFANCIEGKPDCYLRTAHSDKALLAKDTMKACSRHLATYLVACKPLFPQLREAAFKNFLACYLRLLSFDEIPDELYRLTRMALQKADLNGQLAEEVFKVTSANLQALEKNPALVELLESEYGWIWHVCLSKHQSKQSRCSHTQTDDFTTSKASLDLEAQLMSTKEIASVLEKRVQRQEAATKSLQMKNETFQATIESLRVENQKLQTIHRLAATETKKMQATITSYKEANVDLKEKLEKEIIQTTELKHIRNGGELEDAVRKVSIIEREREVARAANKLLREQLFKITTQFHAANIAAEVVAPCSLSVVEAENEKASEQIEDPSRSAQQQQNGEFQNQIRDVTTRRQEEITKLKSLVAELRSDLEQSKDLCNDRTERIAYLEQKIASEQDGRKASHDRTMFLEERLRKNDELLQSQDKLREVAENAADAARTQCEILRQTAEGTRHKLDAIIKDHENLKRKLETAQKDARCANSNYQSAQGLLGSARQESATLRQQANAAKEDAKHKFEELTNIKRAFDRANNEIRKMSRCDNCNNRIRFDFSHSGHRWFGIECRSCGERHWW